MASEYLTIAEIDQKYPNEWVLLTEPKVNQKTCEVFGGRVVLHATTRAEFDRLLPGTAGGPVMAIHYTGQEDPNLVFALNL